MLEGRGLLPAPQTYTFYDFVVTSLSPQNSTREG